MMFGGCAGEPLPVDALRMGVISAIAGVGHTNHSHEI
jgi:hypothetical protein